MEGLRSASYHVGPTLQQRWRTPPLANPLSASRLATTSVPRA